MQNASPYTSLIRSAAIAGALFLVTQVPAHAAITLTIDTSAKTFTWSGTAISDSFSVPESGMVMIRLGAGTFSGGGAVSAGGGSLALTKTAGSSSSVFVSSSSLAGPPTLASSQNTIYTSVGNASNFGSSAATASLTLTGNGQAYSYTNLSSGSMNYLESLNGTQLYFQDDRGGLGVFNIGSAVGQIVVIPEPSSALLLLAAPVCLALRRKRA